MPAETKERQLFNRIAQQYARKDRAGSSAIARKHQLLASLSGMDYDLGTILDIGCGVGAPARHLAGRYREYYGVDVSEEMIAAAREFCRGLPNVEFRTGDVKDLKLPEGLADLVLCVGALHHMSDLDFVMRRLRYFAKPGAGIVAIEPQNGNPFIQALRTFRGWVDRAYSRDQLFFSERFLLDLFQRNGVGELKVDYRGFVTPPFAQVILPPQLITKPLSLLATVADRFIEKHIPKALGKLSFNIVISGRFPK